jgi:hypothetical protein
LVVDLQGGRVGAVGLAHDGLGVAVSECLGYEPQAVAVEIQVGQTRPGGGPLNDVVDRLVPRSRPVPCRAVISKWGMPGMCP